MQAGAAVRAAAGAAQLGAAVEARLLLVQHAAAVLAADRRAAGGVLSQLERLVFGAASWANRDPGWAARRDSLLQQCAAMISACCEALLVKGHVVHGAAAADALWRGIEAAQEVLAQLLELRAKDASDRPGQLMYAIYRSSSQLPSGEAKELFLQTMARPAQRLQLADRLLAPNKCGERLWPRLLGWEHLRLRAGAKKGREEDVVDLCARLP